jgi:uncharacterized protein YbjT (DUF2867 family)
MGETEALMKVLVTGGTGHLGRALIPQLQQRGHQLRVLARGPGTMQGVEWFVGDLASGKGVAEAVSGVDVVIHAATSSRIAQRGRFGIRDFFHSPTNVDVEGTRLLVDRAVELGVRHFLHISIVGLEHTRSLPYSRVKLAAEDVVCRSRVPWSIARATSFYWLLERLCSNMADGRLLAVPSNVRMQPVSSDDFAVWIAQCATDGGRGRREDYAGPQVLSFREILQQYLDARRIRRRIWNMPLPSRMRMAMERGQIAPADAHRGLMTWREWLART